MLDSPIYIPILYKQKIKKREKNIQMGKSVAGLFVVQAKKVFVSQSLQPIVAINQNEKQEKRQKTEEKRNVLRTIHEHVNRYS